MTSWWPSEGNGCGSLTFCEGRLAGLEQDWKCHLCLPLGFGHSRLLLHWFIQKGTMQDFKWNQKESSLWKVMFVQPGFTIQMQHPKLLSKDTKNFPTFNPSAVNSVNVKVTKISTVSWTKGSGLCYSIPTPKCVSMPTWVKLGCWLKGGGQSSTVIKGRLLDSKWKWGCFLP